MIDQQKVHQTLSLPEDPRTFQLALELSLVGLNDASPNISSYVQSVSSQAEYDLGPLAAVPSTFSRTEQDLNSQMSTLPATTPPGLLMPSVGLDDRSKKSQNMTECVPVPSSEHVAEIVGRQGCKIKALRAKTNTYIKTPVRGEEPVFVVTGRKEDVNKAKREILSAADHFSLIRASRKPSFESSNGGLNDNGSGNLLNSAINVARAQAGPPCLPGQITIQVRVPYRVVGLVVGPKGATIKHIQQETQTYIVTPSREKEPIFEVTGLPECVELARKQIEAHIALRTGNSNQGSHGLRSNPVSGDKVSESLESNDFAALHTLNTLSQMLKEELNPELLSAIYKSDLSVTSVAYADCASNMIDGSATASMQLPVVHSLGKSFPKSEVTELLTSAATAVTPITKATEKGYNMSLNGTVKELNTHASEVYSKDSSGNANCSHSNDNVVGNANANANATSSTNTHTTALSFCPPTSIPGNIISNSHVTTNPHLTMSSNTNCSTNLLTRSCSSASSTASTKSTNNSANSTNSVNTPPELLNIWKSLNDSTDVDEGIGDSPSIWHLPSTAVAVGTAAQCSSSASISPTDSLLAEHSLNMSHKSVDNAFKDQSVKNSRQLSTLQINPSKLHTSALHRECCVCNERAVTAALVPCGHNMFCMDCANHICVSMESICPICHSIVYHAMRILA